MATSLRQKWDGRSWPWVTMPLPLSQLFVDRKYQRPLSTRWVEDKAGAFDEYLCHPLVVSSRPGVRYAVFDGQHRLQLLATLGYREWDCLVHTGLKASEEAELWVRLGKGPRKQTQYDIFNAEVFARERAACEIAKAVAEAGYEITPNGKGQYQIAAVKTLREIHGRRGQLDGVAAIGAVLGIITDAWAGAREGVKSEILGGLGRFVQKHHGQYDRKALVYKLAKAGPQGVVVRAAAAQQLDPSSGAREKHFLVGLESIYNGGRRTKHLAV